MAAINNIFFYLFFFMGTAWGHIAEYDDYWLEKQAESKRRLDEVSHPNPHDVVNHFNHHVHLGSASAEDLNNSSSTRRELRRKVAGPCRATNPIDRCWRCDPYWARDRKQLAKCVLGFGRNTTGGLNGRYYLVTDSSDDDTVNPKPGTLRHAALQAEPLWIIFARHMTIKLKQELMVTSNKTIDARGAVVHIAHGAGITIQYARNVIIHGLRIHDIKQGSGGWIRDSQIHYGQRTCSDGDAVSVFGSHDIWLDHLSLSNCKDGLIDVVQGSSGITISNNHMTHHNDVLLFGHHNDNIDDKKMQITVAFNHFGKGLVQRMPRCRLGFFHVVNNDYTHWLMYAIGGSANPTILSEGNRFIAPPAHNAKEVTHRQLGHSDEESEEWKHWIWSSSGDVFQNGAFFTPSGPPDNHHFGTEDKIPCKPGEHAGSLAFYAGSLKCKVGKPC